METSARCRTLGRVWVSMLSAGLLLLLGACNKGSGSSTATLNNTHGTYHTSTFRSVHASAALENLNSCISCHELTGLRSSGGAPTCSTVECHHGTLPGYALPGSHGARAKLAQSASGGGMASCQICHGKDFSGGASGRSCATCHGVKAPHPPKPWRSAAGMTHANADPSNAAVCAQCHLAGSPNNPANHPPAPAPSGSAPGCFNNTLCHSNNVAPHPMGSIWKDATSAAFHGIEAKKDLIACQACHGTPGTPRFDGGLAPTACSSCHAAAKAHSKPWSRAAVAAFPGYVPSHRNAGNRNAACAVCHDVVKDRVAPSPSAPSCFSDSYGGVGCHANGPGKPNHAVPFLDSLHTTVAQPGFDTNCSNCHALSGTSPASAAPNCAACHQGGSPITLRNCSSCHAKPPAGAAFPDIAGKHAKHEALAGIAGACSVCHSGTESGTLAHYDHANGRPGSDAQRTPPAPVKTQASFNAKAGAAVFTPATLSCANISCHGGKATPSWQNGSIDGSTDAGCRACHTLGTALGVPENNSPYSGTHALHLGIRVNALCTECHAMGNGTAGAGNHFKFLGTPQMEGPAADTVAPMGNPAYYKPSNQTCGTFTCHEHLHKDISWQGGPNHAVPYLGTPHTTTTQASFDLDCKSCHSVSGTAPLAAAPNCSACHQGGSPLSVANCASCHAKPPAGSAFPNIAGTHAKHEALTGVTGACSSCHETFDSGTLGHYDHGNGIPGKDTLRVPPAPMKTASAFNAKSGTAALDPSALTCSNISCHGGLKTPNWRTGTLDSASDGGCRQCHSLGSASGVPESNSLFSGLHGYHLGTGVNALCTECHAMGNGTPGASNHFKQLGTPQMEGPASDTVAPMGNPAWYNATKQTCGTFTCHGHPHGDSNWSGGANHEIPFLGAKHLGASQASFDSDCKSCHGLTGSVSPLQSAPTCVVCHQSGSPFTLTNCTSCHAKPPAGTVFPDVAGKHAKHNALAGVTSTCAACHTGSESGSQVHYDVANARPGKSAGRTPPAPVGLPANYTGKAGAATFNTSALTCSNVSCHGGVLAPSWSTGTIVSSSDAGCVQCHQLGTAQGVPESNSHYSGLHALHLAAKAGAVCSECHGMANGTVGANNHFKFLGTAAMEGPASDTVMPMGNASYYQMPAQTCGTFTCHGTLHTNYSWKGGANHAVPFLGATHTGVNSSTSFNTNCASCHAQTGTTSPMATAPTCTACHQAGTPTSLLNCTSCHAKPPSGTSFPNVAGKHAKHEALAGVTNVCAACHTGSDTGSQVHYDHANGRPGKDALRAAPGEVAGSGAYNAKAGAASFNPSTLTCSNVSCHGGVLAPSWSTGSIVSTSDAGCVQCHQLGTAQGVPENNSHYSGMHAYHLALAGPTKGPVVCSDCHGMANGSAGANNHFRFLGTAAMEGPASDTVMPMGNASFYQMPAQTCGTFTCHGTLHTNYSWKGGANHAVPFLGPLHTIVNNPATFASNCASCHALTGTSPMSVAPNCATCHQAGTPTTLANCTSCHAKPPTGSAFPNVAGTHPIHNGLNGGNLACATCHTGSDTGSQVHYDHANGRPGKDALRAAPGEVSVAASYNAKTGTASFNASALTCSNISCHGGQATPGWTNTASIAANCTACHVRGTTQYNSFNSGEHKKHVVDEGFACNQCHDMTAANTKPGALNHFKFLGTTAMEGPASDTIGFGASDATGTRTYNVANQYCLLSCHGKTHTSQDNW